MVANEWFWSEFWYKIIGHVHVFQFFLNEWFWSSTELSSVVLLLGQDVFTYIEVVEEAGVSREDYYFKNFKFGKQTDKVFHIRIYQRSVGVGYEPWL